MKKNKTNKENVVEQIQREKKPFWINGTDIIAYKVRGDTFFFDDYSGVAHINGDKEKVEEAIADGSLCGKIISFSDDVFSLIPLVRTHYFPDGRYETKVDSVQCCMGKTPQEWCKELNADHYKIIGAEV